MPISIAERKYRMPYGGQKEAAGIAEVDETYVSRVFSGQVRPKTKEAKLKFRRTQVALARVMKMAVDELFTADEVALGAQRSQLARSA